MIDTVRSDQIGNDLLGISMGFLGVIKTVFFLFINIFTFISLIYFLFSFKTLMKRGQE